MSSAMLNCQAVAEACSAAFFELDEKVKAGTEVDVGSLTAITNLRRLAHAAHHASGKDPAATLQVSAVDFVLIADHYPVA